MSAENKAVAQKLYDVINSNALDSLDALIAVNVNDHNPSPGVAPGLAGTKQTLSMYHAVFSDLRVTAEDMIADGDKVVVRLTMTGTHTGEFMGLPPTGKPVTMSGIEMFRLAGGQIAERWAEFDMMSLMQQLGVMG
ncbi:MAG: ester cyclase [Anaerolineaceae bacterium]|nr:ester cyclase [Anaerolineaceae bacterium]MCB9099454.1 ester cyclase [Anaerolineales bacterium]